MKALLATLTLAVLFAGSAAAKDVETLMHHANDVLPRRQAVQDLALRRLLADPCDKIAHNVVVDIRLEQRQTDLPQPLGELAIGEPPLAAQAGERPVQPIAQGLKHRALPRSTSPARRGRPISMAAPLPRSSTGPTPPPGGSAP